MLVREETSKSWTESVVEAIDRLEDGSRMLRIKTTEGGLREDNQSQRLLSWSWTFEDHKERVKQTRGG